jgi:hypothetical protein
MPLIREPRAKISRANGRKSRGPKTARGKFLSAAPDATESINEQNEPNLSLTSHSHHKCSHVSENERNEPDRGCPPAGSPPANLPWKAANIKEAVSEGGGLCPGDSK